MSGEVSASARRGLQTRLGRRPLERMNARLFSASLAVILLGCGASDPVSPDPGPGTIEERVDAWLSSMTVEEKVDQMHGSSIAPVQGLWETPVNERLGIPGFKMVDGPRGVRANAPATTFPVGSARGATFNVDLERRVGEAIGLETAGKGGNVILAPTINVLRHPRWGRAQETYGEDTWHVGEMGAAFVEGAQQHVLASAKHLAANSIEDTRQTVDVTIDERSLREVYLAQFEKVVRRAHVASVMSAYNKVNGRYCSENPHLLRDVLKGDWEFDGFVESDWILGTHSTVDAALAGLDVEMPLPAYFGQDLVLAATSGEVPMDTIDDAVRRILRKKLELHLDAPAAPGPEVVESDEHVALTLEVARAAIGLRRNEAAALPLDRAALSSIVGGGELADRVNLGDEGSSNAVPSFAVTPLAGIEDRAGAAITVTSVPGPTLSAADEAAITAAGAAVVVVGLTAEDEGENLENLGGGDRASLELSAEHQALVEAVGALNPRTIVVVEGSGAFVAAPWIDATAALLMAWYPGQEGGHAIADVLFGDVSPSGKLPVTFPTSEAELPPFDNQSDAVTYGYFHGYRWVDRNGDAPAFPFGFGLSYTSFAYANLALDQATIAPDGTVRITADVTNTGAVAGQEVAQLYVGFEGSSVERPVRQLAAFTKVALEAGETRSVSFDVAAKDLAYWDAATAGWVVEPILYDVSVGTSSRDLSLTGSFEITSTN